MEENIYKLLEVDPTITDINVIKDAAQKKIKWLNGVSQNPKYKKIYNTEFQPCKTILTEATNNPDKFLEDLIQHSKDYLQQIEKEAIEKEDEIRSKASMYVVNGEISKVQLDVLVDKFKRQEGDILRILRARIRQPKVLKKPSNFDVPELERSMFNRIVSLLQIVNKNDLYDFLDLKKDSLHNDIKTKCDNIRAENYNIPATNIAKAPTDSLCSDVQTILYNDEKRLQYDKSLFLLKIKDIYSKIDLATSLNSVQYKTLLNDCVKMQINKDDAEYYIHKYCEDKNIEILESSDGTLTKRCPQCHSIGCEHSGILIKYSQDDNFCAYCTKVKLENDYGITDSYTGKKCPKCGTIGFERNGVFVKYSQDDNFCVFCTKTKLIAQKLNQ